MRCKSFEVAIEVEVHAITCPGVWLCPSGKVTLQIYLMGLCGQTEALNPIFPLLYHEKFIFRKNYTKTKSLFDLNYKLSYEVVYLELIQWENCEQGNVLATFISSLEDMLYPLENKKGIIAGVEVDLLMETTKRFPGIISPKVEVTTKLRIEETLCSLKRCRQNDLIVVHPKLISSKCIPRRNTNIRQKKVCHTTKYHRAKKNQTDDDCLCTEPAICAPRFLHPPKICPRRPVCPRRPEHICLRKSPVCTQPEVCSQTSSKKMSINSLKSPVNLSPNQSADVSLKSSPVEFQNSGNTSPKSGSYRLSNSLRESLNGKGQKYKTCCICTCNESKGSNCQICKKYEDYFQSSCSENNSSYCKCQQPEVDTEQKDENCYCDKQSFRSYLTDEIHERLENILHTRKGLYGTPPPKCSKSRDDFNVKFYRSLEQFYKKLYERAHYKLKNTKYVCNC